MVKTYKKACFFSDSARSPHRTAKPSWERPPPSVPEGAPGGGLFRSAIAERHVRISIQVVGVCERGGRFRPVTGTGRSPLFCPPERQLAWRTSYDDRCPLGRGTPQNGRPVCSVLAGLSYWPGSGCRGFGQRFCYSFIISTDTSLHPHGHPLPPQTSFACFLKVAECHLVKIAPHMHNLPRFASVIANEILQVASATLRCIRGLAIEQLDCCQRLLVRNPHRCGVQRAKALHWNGRCGVVLANIYKMRHAHRLSACAADKSLKTR